MSDINDLAVMIGRVDERTALTHEMLKDHIERETASTVALKGRVSVVERRQTRAEAFGAGIAGTLTTAVTGIGLWLRYKGHAP